MLTPDLTIDDEGEENEGYDEDVNTEGDDTKVSTSVRIQRMHKNIADCQTLLKFLPVWLQVAVVSFFMLMLDENILCWDFAHVASMRNCISVFCFMSSLLLWTDCILNLIKPHFRKSRKTNVQYCK